MLRTDVMQPVFRLAQLFPASGVDSDMGYRRGTLVSVVVILALLSATFSSGAEAAGGTWTYGAGPIGILEAGTVRADGNALVLTGSGHCSGIPELGCSIENTTWLFQATTGTWQSAPAPSFRFQDSTLVPLADGGALLVGGSNCKDERFPERCVPSSDAFRLDPLSETWSRANPLRVPRARPTAVSLRDGRVLVAGGFGEDCAAGGAPGSYGCAVLSSAEIYDPGGNIWSPVDPLPGPDGGGAGVALPDGSALVLIPGHDGSAAVRYEPSSARWRSAGHTAASAGAQLVAPPGARPLVLLGGEPYAGFFGSLGSAAAALAPRCDTHFAEAYEGGETWVPAPSLATTDVPEGCPHAAALAGGQVLVAAAPGGSWGPRLLDAAQVCWSDTAPPPPPAANGLVLGLPDGRGLVTASLGGAYLYAPGGDECEHVRPTPRLERFAGVAILPPRRLAGGRVRIELRCPITASRGCQGTLTVSLRVGSRPMGRPARVHRTFALRAGAIARFRIHLSSRWRNRLRRRGTRLALTVRAREVGGTEFVVTKATAR